MTPAAILAIALLSSALSDPPEAPANGAAVHDQALRRAQVWTEPATPIDEARFGENPRGRDSFAIDQVVECAFKPGGVSGSTPKFECELPGGERVKVKYGASNPEVYTEVAASRLLSALGFPTDRMYVVGRVRCFGCSSDPFEGLQCVNEGTPIAICFPGLDYARAEEFTPAVIERPIEGRRIEAGKERGWKWEELVKIDPAAGGATRDQVDALRLLAVLLGHWDNKAGNQRLLCLGEKSASAKCDRPLAMVQDLGSTFGPDKLDLTKWAATPIWMDAATCSVSMKALPYGGSTFPDIRITEGGRQFLAGRLGKLSTAQIRELFEGARISSYPHKTAEARDVGQWVRAFEDKVRAIVDRAPCPDAS